MLEDGLTPHSEKQSICRPSGAHSAFTRPSTPASILADHSSSLILYTFTMALRAEAARRNSESADQPMWLNNESDEEDRATGVGLLELVDSDWTEGDGERSTCHARVIWNESARRTMRRSCIPLAMKLPPDEKETISRYLCEHELSSMAVFVTHCCFERRVLYNPSQMVTRKTQRKSRLRG